MIYAGRIEISRLLHIRLLDRPMDKAVEGFSIWRLKTRYHQANSRDRNSPTESLFTWENHIRDGVKARLVSQVLG